MESLHRGPFSIAAFSRVVHARPELHSLGLIEKRNAHIGQASTMVVDARARDDRLKAQPFSRELFDEALAECPVVVLSFARHLAHDAVLGRVLRAPGAPVVSAAKLEADIAAGDDGEPAAPTDGRCEGLLPRALVPSLRAPNVRWRRQNDGRKRRRASQRVVGV